MIATAKNLSWVDVPEAGHVVTVDKPQEFIAVTTGVFGGVGGSVTTKGESQVRGRKKP